jgi:hypothetical protein
MAARTAADKAAWQAQRLAQERARGLTGYDSTAINDFINANATTPQPASKVTPRAPAPRPPNPFGPRGSLAKAIDESLKKNAPATQKVVNQAIANRMRPGQTLHFNGDSTCLADLKWKDGIATAEFYRGGQIIYDYPMSKSEFIDWVSSGSIGKYGNAEVF